MKLKTNIKMKKNYLEKILNYLHDQDINSEKNIYINPGDNSQLMVGLTGQPHGKCTNINNINIYQDDCIGVGLFLYATSEEFKSYKSLVKHF